MDENNVGEPKATGADATEGADRIEAPAEAPVEEVKESEAA